MSERHRPVEGILLLAGIAGSFAAISEQMGKEYGMTRKQLRVMLLFLMVGFFNFALNLNYYTDETLLKRDQTAFKEMKILHVREQEKYIAYEGTAHLPSGRRRVPQCRDYWRTEPLCPSETVVRVSGN